MRDLTKSTIISAVICLILGIVLICHPVKAALAMFIAIGAGLLLIGIFNIISYKAGKKKGTAKPFGMVTGVFTLVLGISCLLGFRIGASLVQYVMGILIILHGITNISQAIQTKKLGFEKWTMVLVMGIITLILGLFLLSAPFFTTVVVNVIAGIFLLFDAVSDIIVCIKVSASEAGKAARAAEKAERAEAKAAAKAEKLEG